MESILVVEDDPSIRLGLEMNLRQEGFHVLASADGQEGLELALDKRPDLIILDVMLPRMSGYEICKALRTREILTPVIMVTCRTDEIDKIMGLDLGADDYITKPFSLRELLARVNAHLRRQRAYESVTEVFNFGPFALDVEGQMLVRGGSEQIELPNKEFGLLRFLVGSANKVQSREQILQKVWGFDYYGTDRTVDNFINKLRHKIEADAANPQYIVTVRGAGYKFVPEPTADGSGIRAAVVAATTPANSGAEGAAALDNGAPAPTKGAAAAGAAPTGQGRSKTGEARARSGSKRAGGGKRADSSKRPPSETTPAGGGKPSATKRPARQKSNPKGAR